MTTDDAYPAEREPGAARAGRRGARRAFFAAMLRKPAQIGAVAPSSPSLAGLAGAGVVFAQVTGQLNFLSYGSTARAARLHGAGRRSAAVGEGVQATWLALAVGLLVLGIGQLVAGPVTRALGDGGAVAAAERRPAPCSRAARAVVPYDRKLSCPVTCANTTAAMASPASATAPSRPTTAMSTSR